MVNKFTCGLCKKDKRIPMTRKDLRAHLREEHRIMSKIANASYERATGYNKQDWWLAEEMK